MTFGESIQTCFSKYADFSGRASRSEYWWWVLFCALAAIVSGIVSSTIYLLICVVMLLPSIAVCTRRLHDVDKSGWFQLLNLVPLIGWIPVLYWTVQRAREPNRF